MKFTASKQDFNRDMFSKMLQLVDMRTEHIFFDTAADHDANIIMLEF